MNMHQSQTAAAPRQPAYRIVSLAFLLALTGAVVPGPLFVLVVGQVPAQGGFAVAYIMAGHALVELCFVTLLAVGLRHLLDNTALRSGLSLLGGLVLIWMGISLLSQEAAGLTPSEANALPPVVLVLAGAAVSLANPYFTGWWLTIGTGQVASLNLRKLRDYILFYIGHELGDVAWYFFIAVLLVVGVQWLNPEVYQQILTFCGILMTGGGLLFIFLAARLAYTGRRRRSIPGFLNK